MGGEGSPRPPAGRTRVGIFGGTFDPFHVGHLVVAQDVLEALTLDRVLFVPAASPPHKGDAVLAPAELRLRMVAQSVSGDPRFDAIDLELRRDGPSYTVDTLKELEATEPDAALHLLMGVDQWAAFGSWREPGEIARRARIVVMTRNGERASDVVGAAEADAGSAWDVHDVPVTRIDLSSTGIRTRVADGRSVRYLVPEPVRRIIETEKLYR